MENSPYFDLSRSAGGSGSVHDFVLSSLLRSRIDCGFESDAAQHDEEVNVYLVHMLSDLATAPSVASAAALRDIDVFERIRLSQDPRFKGEVYRTSADRLLVATGIFTDTPFTARDGQRVFVRPAQARIGRGKTYYHFAAMFHSRTRSRTAALARILDRLSADFERYVEVLFHMRGEYFHLYSRLSNAALLSLQSGSPEDADAPDARTEVERARDDFLDAFGAWHDAPNASSREAVLAAITRLRALDPDFTFDLPEN